MVESGKVDTGQYDVLQREITETGQRMKSLTKEYNNFGSISAQKIAEAISMPSQEQLTGKLLLGIIQIVN